MSTPTPANKVNKVKSSHDRSHDVLRSASHPLDAIFTPRSVAVIGASEREGSVGRSILKNLISTPFGGTVYPVNEKRPNVLGIRAYKKISDIPEPVDLAVIITPSSTVPDIIADCVANKVGGAIVISAGFKEQGKEGEELEHKILQNIKGSGMRIIGPNCLGVMNPLTGVNATFAATMARPGNVAFISQSGALCTAVLDWCEKEMVGFSAFVSIGSMLDVNWGDLIDYLGNDPRTHSIVIYMESVGDARSLLSAAREVALSKPVIIIKPGRTAAAAKAAASHTGSLTGSDEVIEAAFRRCGALRVNTIAELFYMAQVLGKQPRPKGPRLAIVTNAGGPGVLAADALIMNDGQMAEISPETMDELNKFLPAFWSHGNPIDVLGDALPDRYEKTLEVVAKDPNVDGMLVVLTPQGMTDATQTAEQMKSLANSTGKPVIASWMGGPAVAAGIDILNKNGVPNFPYPDTAAKIFTYMWRHTYALRGLYETPSLRGEAETGIDRATADKIVDKARKSGRTILTEVESKQLLAAYGIPTVETLIANTEDEAVQRAQKIGYPVVLKLYSETITHKTDVGGVLLNLKDEKAVRAGFQQIGKSVADKVGKEHFLGVTVQPMAKLDGYELIIGSSVDGQLGPVLLFGSGGQLVEVYKDRALALPPLNSTLARRVMEQTKVYTALKGVRGRKAVDLAALEELLVRFSQLVAEQRWIKEIDINPLLASPDRLLALDARVVVYGKDVTEDKLPKLAIRPYPTQYIKPWKMKNGENVNVRPIRPEDEPLMVRFHEALSERSVYMRYFQPLKLSQRVSHERLTRICFIDYDREMLLVTERKDEKGSPQLIGIGRLSKLRGANDAEMAVLVDDRYQHQGMGTELCRRVIEVAKEEKLDRVISTMLSDNVEMQAICRKLGFTLKEDMEEGTVRAELKL